MGAWYSKTEFSTWSLACSRWFNVTSFMGDIFAEQLAHDGIVDQQQVIAKDFVPPCMLYLPCELANLQGGRERRVVVPPGVPRR